MSQQTNTSPLPAERSQAAVALDNLIRRHLRVTDPRDPEAISNALRARYADEQAALDQEAAGLPFFKVARIETQTAVDTSTSAELRQARGDVEQDLTALTTNALLKDIHPELRGWSHTLREVINEGTNAARFALDPWQRDRAMGARRLLGEYARVARYVGALTPNLSVHYRQLAKSLDEVAGVILVQMGEALSRIGYAGRFLIQAPASELQARRDAIIHALRNFVGTTQSSYGPNDWPRGLLAYQQFLSRLDAAGQTDLRSLFQEIDVARSLDQLIHHATAGSSDDLRALGATAHLTLGRFRRLIRVSRNLVAPASPPLSAYLTAVQLFLDAFNFNASGYRLLFVARPPIVFYGLYGTGGPDNGTFRLLEIIALRGRLAEMADCYLGCDCAQDRTLCQVMLDKIVYDLDRAIDLYAMGADADGKSEPEQRAAAYAVVIEEYLKGPSGSRSAVASCIPSDSNLEKVLKASRDQLWFNGQPTSGLSNYDLRAIHQELCLQRDNEMHWESLLRTMAPSCSLTDPVLEGVRDLVERAIESVRGLDISLPDECPEPCIPVPPHHESSLNALANDVPDTGDCD
ncbi:hypothetical protein [Thiocapsa bogorovii]|uniref:hypothetical protein n=1 Tax=Thiocapsa bogorovii TaxID=521689 RepID=UPI001E344150|nr:hypothetical protein [Thiocapsa bogorovii]UHD15648.1 hypothetical protein LT988_20695 [Thiocapsa bogorovii]